MALVYKSAAYRPFSAVSDNRWGGVGGWGGVCIVFSDINFISILTSVNIADIMNVNIC